ncbi:hypothetical protein [Streptomyces sp. NBC_00539]|uniref:hypothetical protein n=1 Tax=Streptomyces sp. NBC_00539 TaxID=2975770 RepID=UPI002E812308|nr:hypothetical protein [Streptomyces sp. NBC_00539]WUC62789.1 hypothetical protein OG861_00325 [Streptomyces sp. NBC_00539]
MSESEVRQTLTILAQVVSEADKATLTVEERDGEPVLTVTEGTAIPSGLTVLDETGKPIAAYVLAVLPSEQAGGPEIQTRATNVISAYPAVYIDELSNLSLSVSAGATAVPIFADSGELGQ